MYTIGGNSFSDYNIQILSSDGALDIPGRLGDTGHNWGDSIYGYSVEPFVLSDDLIWDGRMITLHGYYSGSDFITDIETLENAVKGYNRTLITPYGSHTVRLSKIIEKSQIRANTKAFVDLVFWEQTVMPGTAPVAIGGTGVRLGGYDFLNDFGMIVSKVNGYGITPEYEHRVISYGDYPATYSGYRRPREIRIELAGHYADISTLTTKVNALKSLLMSAGTKQLIYRGSTKTVYFTEGAKVQIGYKTKSVRIILKLKLQE